MKKIGYLLCIMLCVAACSDGSEAFNKENYNRKKVDNVERATKQFQLIEKDYKSGNLFKENFPEQTGDLPFSHLWAYDAIVSGAANLEESGQECDYKALADGFECYYMNEAHHNTIGGYGSSTDGNTGKDTRFYDDNSIVGISLLKAYKITKNEVYLQRASRIIDFLKSGMDNTFGGGLWWNEDEKNIAHDANSNKPACANGYATRFLLEFASLTPDQNKKQETLSLAKGLYNWLRSNLYDSLNKCYWNDKNSDGQINKMIWTYNTGVMIQNGILLYNLTQEKHYLDEAKASADGAYSYFVKTRNGILSYPDHDPWFNTKLLEAYVDILPYYGKVSDYIEDYSDFINNGYDNARTNDGLFYEDWTGANPGRYYSLLMQACVVESYGLLAKYNHQSK